jgi:hypothetical protein
MAQHDYNIEDQNGFDFLVDLNNALSAIVTNNAGSFEPNPTFAHMLWFDKNNDLMKVRNETNSAWVIVAKKDGNGWTPYRQGTALGTASVQPDNRYAHRSNNLSDMGSATTARANLGVAEDSSDADFTNSPNAAARRGLVDAKLSTLTQSTLPSLVDAELSTFPFSKEYQSTGQTMIAGGLLTLAHGLPADPKLIRLYAIATAPTGGLSVGDKLDLTATVNSFTQGGSMGLTVTFDSTNIYIKNGNSTYLWHIPSMSTGNRTDLGRDYFDLYVEAYA